MSRLGTVIGAVLVCALAFWLNPSPEQHRARIKSALSERNLVSKALGVGALTAFASNYSSLGIASYTTVNGRVVSIGALGMVYVRDPAP